MEELLTSKSDLPSNFCPDTPFLRSVRLKNHANMIVVRVKFGDEAVNEGLQEATRGSSAPTPSELGPHTRVFLVFLEGLEVLEDQGSSTRFEATGLDGFDFLLVWKPWQVRGRQASSEAQILTVRSSRLP